MDMLRRRGGLCIMDVASGQGGLGTAELALEFISSASVRHGLGAHFRSLWSCDNDPVCQKVLCRYVDRGCVFSDIIARLKYGRDLSLGGQFVFIVRLHTQQPHIQHT
jgi:hypothetical protein